LADDLVVIKEKQIDLQIRWVKVKVFA